MYGPESRQYESAANNKCVYCTNSVRHWTRLNGWLRPIIVTGKSIIRSGTGSVWPGQQKGRPLHQSEATRRERLVRVLLVNFVQRHRFLLFDFFNHLELLGVQFEVAHK